MKPGAVLLAGAALLGCGAGRRAAAPAAPAVAPSRVPVSAAYAPLHHRVQAPLVYEIARFDSLYYEPQGNETAQVSDKTGLLLIRPGSGREGGRLEVVLQTIAAGPGTRLAVSSLDSAAGARWWLSLGPSGPEGAPTGEPASVLAEQMLVIGGLLFPQLPQGGVKPGDTWSDSASYRVRVDTFDAVESAARTSGAKPAVDGVRVEAAERLGRSGGTSQGGQSMSLSGGGARWLSYDFAAQGFVTFLSARDSLDLRVRVEATGQIIPVRWRSTLTARLRGAAPR